MTNMSNANCLASAILMTLYFAKSVSHLINYVKVLSWRHNYPSFQWRRMPTYRLLNNVMLRDDIKDQNNIIYVS